MQFLDVVLDNKSTLAEIEAVRTKFPKAHVAAATDDDANPAIRFDLRFPAGGPPDCPFEMWFDHAIVQETSPTYAEDLLRFLKGGEGKLSEGPAFRKMLNKKINKYASLTAVAHRLTTEHKLDFQPHFVYPIISSLGFLNADFVALNKFIVDRFRATQSELPDRTDGLSVKYLTGRFKVQIRDSLCFALIKGNALAAWNQGLRHTCKPP